MFPAFHKCANLKVLKYACSLKGGIPVFHSIVMYAYTCLCPGDSLLKSCARWLGPHCANKGNLLPWMTPCLVNFGPNKYDYLGSILHRIVFYQYSIKQSLFSTRPRICSCLVQSNHLLKPTTVCCLFFVISHLQILLV